jgi:hypothetical protein
LQGEQRVENTGFFGEFDLVRFELSAASLTGLPALHAY